MDNIYFEALAAYDEQLTKALRLTIVRGLTGGDQSKLGEIYTALTGRKSNMKTGCSTCKMRVIKDLARIYADEKAARAIKAVGAEVTESVAGVVEAEVEEAPKRKRATRKKAGIKTNEE